MTEIHNQLSIIAASYNKKGYQLKNGVRQNGHLQADIVCPVSQLVIINLLP